MRILLSILFSLLALPVLAAASPLPQYAIDSAHTRVTYSVSHMGYSFTPGHFSEISGTIAFDPAQVEKSRVDITIKTASVSMDFKPLDDKIQSADFFDVAQYPTITFKSTAVKKTGAMTGLVTGDLTLHGVTKPVTLNVTFNKKGWNKYEGVEQVGFSATGTLKRSDFGMAAYTPDIGDAIPFAIQTEAHAPKAEDAAAPNGEAKPVPAASPAHNAVK